MNGSPPSLARGSATMLLSMATAGALSLLVSISIARMLGVADFGVYSLLISVQGIVVIFAGFGLGPSITKFVAEYRVRDPEGALSFAKTGAVLVLLLASLMSIVYALLAVFIGKGLYNEPAMMRLIPYSALVVFSNALLSVALGIVQGCQRIKLLATMQVATPALNVAFITLFLHFAGTPGIFIGYFLSQCMVAVVVLLRLNASGFNFFSAPFELRRTPTLSKLLSFAFPAVLGAIMVMPVFWIGNTELTLSAGFQAMGYFAIAFVVFQSMNLIPNAIVTPMFPKVSELSGVDHTEIERLSAKVVRTLGALLFPLLFGLGLFARPIIGLLYGSSYVQSTDVVYLMIAACYFYALSALVGGMIAGMGRMWIGLGINACWAAVFILVATITIPSWGVNGLGAAFAISYVALLCTAFAVAKRLLRINLRSSYLTSVSAGAFFAVGFFLVREGGMADLLLKLGLFVAGCAYFFVIAKEVYVSMFNRVRNILERILLSRSR